MLSQVSAFIFPIADICTVLLAAFLAMYGPRIVYALIDVILGGVRFSFHPEEGYHVGFVVVDYGISADAAEALAQGAMWMRTRIELCAETYLFHAQCRIFVLARYESRDHTPMVQALKQLGTRASLDY